MKKVSTTEKKSRPAKGKRASESRTEIQALRAENERLEQLIAIHRLWLKHRGKLFPTECGGKEAAGIDLVTLDSYTAGCVSVFLQRGKLDDPRREVLRSCEKDLAAVHRHLEGYAGFYYRQLKKLASEVLSYIDRHR